MEEDSGRIAEMLRRWANGDKEALGALVPVVYQELRRLAHRHPRAERAGHTLQSTGLVNEAFIRLFEGQACTLADRGHFIAVASRTMRQILAHTHAAAGRKSEVGDSESPWRKSPICRSTEMRTCWLWTGLWRICLGSMSVRARSSRCASSAV